MDSRKRAVENAVKRYKKARHLAAHCRFRARKLERESQDLANEIGIIEYGRPGDQILFRHHYAPELVRQGKILRFEASVFDDIPMCIIEETTGVETRIVSGDSIVRQNNTTA